MSLKILLAEDSLVNQKVVSGLLRKLGHELEIVENGLDAVSSWENGHFDLILMDIHMPAMDGMEATRRIRALESKLESRIPIFALSGNEDSKSKEDCLKAGMDRFLTKPLQTDELKILFKALVENEEATTSVNESPAKSEANIESPLDLSAALKNVGGDQEILESTIELLFEECPKQFSQLCEGIRQNDLKLVTRAAHTLKSTFALVAAETAMLAAKKVEEFGRNEKHAELDAAISKLKFESDKVMECLSQSFPPHKHD